MMWACALSLLVNANLWNVHSYKYKRCNSGPSSFTEVAHDWYLSVFQTKDPDPYPPNLCEYFVSIHAQHKNIR